MISKDTSVYSNFSKWLTSAGGGSKSLCQSDQIAVKLLKYLYFASQQVPEKEDMSIKSLDYCLGCTSSISDFVDHLQKNWKVGHSGTLGYMNAISHALDYRRSMGITYAAMQAFVMSEVYLQRVKRSLGKKMQFRMENCVEH